MRLVQTHRKVLILREMSPQEFLEHEGLDAEHSLERSSDLSVDRPIVSVMSDQDVIDKRSRLDVEKTFWKYFPGAVRAQPSFSGDRAVKSAFDVKDKMTADCSRAGWNAVVETTLQTCMRSMFSGSSCTALYHWSLSGLPAMSLYDFGTETTVAMVKQDKSKSRA